MNLASSILTAGITAFFAAVVLVVGQVIQRLFIEPVQEQRKALGEVDYYCILLDTMKNVYGATAIAARVGAKPMYGMELDDAFRALRLMAAKLQASLRVIPCYGWLESMRWVKRRDLMNTIIQNLIVWANNLDGGDPEPAREAIRRALADDAG